MRLGAFLLDCLVATVVFFTIVALSVILPDVLPRINAMVWLEREGGPWVTAIGYLAVAQYFVGSWSSGRTLGMRAFRLRLVGENGKTISDARAWLRLIALVFAALPLAIGLISAAFDPKKQGWHDRIAGTYVVDAQQS